MSILQQVQVKVTDRILAKVAATFAAFSTFQSSANASTNSPQTFEQQLLQPISLTEIAFVCMIIAAIILTHRKIRD